MKTIAIIGAGTGGIVSANLLSARLKGRAEIVLFEKAGEYVFAPSLLWMMVGKRSGAQISRKFKSKRGLRIYQEEVQSVNFPQKTIRTSLATHSYDYLILTPGAELYPDKLPGFSDSALNLYTKDGSAQILSSLKDFKSGRIVVLVSSLPYKCPAAPYEAAFLIDAYCKANGKKAEVEIVAPESLPMPAAGEEIGRNVSQMLAQRGIKYSPGRQAAQIDPNKRIIFEAGGAEFAYDLLVGIPPHGLPAFLQGSPVVSETGWIKVDPATLETTETNVFGIGDAASILMKNGKPLPKAGVFAHEEAEVVADIIASRILGLKTNRTFRGHGACFLETGFGKAGYASGDFLHAPAPLVRMKRPSFLHHLTKVGFEKWWLWKWF